MTLELVFACDTTAHCVACRTDCEWRRLVVQQARLDVDPDFDCPRGVVIMRGLGDAIAAVTHATGIDRVAKAIAGEKCGCEERREALNRMMPF